MPTAENLRTIKTFEPLVRYLEDELDWPLNQYGLEDLTFEYAPEELGLRDEEAAKVRAIRQLRPLMSGLPWGIFFIEFEKKTLPVVVLRRILSHLVIKKRASANRAEQVAFAVNDLLLIAAFGEESSDQREIAFAHFHQTAGDLPTLRVLGWEGADTPLKLVSVAATLQNRLHWPNDPANHAAWRTQWTGAFRHRLGHNIKTANELAEALATLARQIRDAALTLIAHESEQGPLRKLHQAFRTALIHDLSEADFADTYAQTITYGLLTAAISRTEMSEGRHGTALLAENVADIVPVTNPFLKEMLQTFLTVGGRQGGIDFDELGIQDVVELLRSDETDLPAVLQDFGNRTQGEDPVIHFYEHFLSAYNKKLKVQRGVFYTPQPVVSYIVRSVHELLQTEFGLEDGLASTVTWGEMVQRHPSPASGRGAGGEGGITIPDGVSPNSPFVQILDPATGTATFLVEVIAVIHRTLTAKWKAQQLNEQQQIAAWNEYVPKHLLPRLHGYELMMAPYAIAHMKIGLKLHETGYRFQSEERVRVYLTNALEPASDAAKQQQFEQLAPELAHEAQAVNEVKRNQRFTLVIGNPPYSYISANLTRAAADIIEPFRFVDGERIREKSALSLERSLQDDFVKFFGLSLQLKVKSESIFIVGFITNNSYMDSPLHRGLRGELIRHFSHIYFINLFGDSIKDREQNVFDIQQGVAIILAFSSEKLKLSSNIYTSYLHGNRTEKYQALNYKSWQNSKFLEIKTIPPQRYFLHLETSGEFSDWLSLTDIFNLTSTCIKTLKDGLATGFKIEEVQQKIDFFCNPETSKNNIKEQFGVEDLVQWKVEPARQAIQNLELNKFIRKYQARPFDYRWMFYHSAIVGSPRSEVMRNLLRKTTNFAIIANRKVRTGSCQHFWVTSTICVSEIISSADNSNCFVLYVFEDEKSLKFENSYQPNFSIQFLKKLCYKLNLPENKNNKLPQSVTPESIFYYIYAVFHSPAYRTRYAEFLKIDFPRVPLTSSLDLFRALSKLGGELVALHLMESPKLDQHLTTYTGPTAPVIDKVSWANNTVWLDKKQSCGFIGVPENVWDFHIGGYQVCNKWLKDRKDRTLSTDDLTHYHRIVVALSETIHLMAEIDVVIEQYGGWPGAFSEKAD